MKVFKAELRKNICWYFAWYKTQVQTFPSIFQVKFSMDDTTTLSDLLSLNLHNFEDEVRGIVDKAVKEMSMEKVLKELDVTWSQMEFEHDKHTRTQVTMLKASEELIETLEDNQVCVPQLHVQ